MHDGGEGVERALASGLAFTSRLGVRCPSGGKFGEAPEFFDRHIAENLSLTKAHSPLHLVGELADSGVVFFDPLRGATLALGVIVASPALAESCIAPGGSPTKLRYGMNPETRLAKPQFFVGYNHRLGPVLHVDEGRINVALEFARTTADGAICGEV